MNTYKSSRLVFRWPVGFREVPGSDSCWVPAVPTNFSCFFFRSIKESTGMESQIGDHRALPHPFRVMILLQLWNPAEFKKDKPFLEIQWVNSASNIKCSQLERYAAAEYSKSVCR